MVEGLRGMVRNVRDAASQVASASTQVASASDAPEVCAAVRKELGSLASSQIADTVRVLYGGSVNAKNIGDIVAQEDVDGDPSGRNGPGWRSSVA